MASGTLSTRPQAESAPTQGRYEDFIQKRLEHTRRQVRLVDVASGAMLLAVVSLLFFLAVAVLDHWVFHHGLGFIARLGLFALWVAAAGAFVWRFLVPPLANRINPVFAAQTIEQGRPTLKNSLINFLMLRSHPQDVAPLVFRAMEHRAAADLLKVPVDHAVDRGRVVHLAYALAAVIGIFALYLALSPKNPLVSAARVLWPWSSVAAPTRVHIEEVVPGDKIVFNDDRETISAQVTGLRDGEEVSLLVGTADGQVVDDRIVMTRVDDANHYHCDLPSGSGGFQQDTFYCITAGDCTTPKYTLEVQIAPTIIVDRIDYHFPPYTGQADRTMKNQGDIKALEGTQVTIHATANMEIKEPRIDLNCEGLQMRSMTIANGAQATGQFILELDPNNPGKAQYDSYQILFTDTNGHGVRRPVRYHIDVDRDFPPDVEIVEPRQEEVAVAEDGQLKIRVHAFDTDYGLRQVTLQAEHDDHQKLDLPVLLDRTKPDKAWPKPFDREYTFRPANLKLKAGDQVHYWATADDNKEPRPNHSETAHRTVRIVGSGQSGQKDPQNPPNGGEGQPQSNETKPNQGGAKSKTEKAEGDPSNKDGPGEQQADHASGDKTKRTGQEIKPNDPQQGNKKDQGQQDNGGGPGKEKASSEEANGQKNSEPNSGEASDEPKKIDPVAQPADAIRTTLEDMNKDQQKKDQQNHTEPSSSEQKPDQKQDPGQKGDNQQGSPQQGGQKQDGQQGGQQPQGNSSEKKEQGGNPGGQQPQSGKPDSGGQQPQGDPQSPNGQGNSKSSPQQGNSSGQSGASSQPQGGADSGNQQSGNQPSTQNNGGKGNESKSSAGPKDGQGASGQSKPDPKQPGGEKGPQKGSASGSPKPEKPQPGSEQGKDESAGGGTPPKSEKKQSGSQGGGDEKQLAQGGPKPNEKKPAGGAGSESPNPPGGVKPENKPKDDKSNSQGGGQGSKSKPEEKQGGGDQSSGGWEKPKTGQGDQSGSQDGGKKPDGGKPTGNKGGTADGEPGQKDPGKSSKVTPQDNSGAPAPQVDREHGEQKTGNARETMNPKSDNPQSPGNSKHDSNNNSDTRGERKGGGGAGGGEKDQKAGTGAAGTHSPASDGGAVSNEKGGDATGNKAGEAARSTDRTGSQHKESGKGDGEKHEPANEQTAKDDSQKPQGDSTQNSADSPEKSSGGTEGAKSSKQAGNQGSGLPAGGSQAPNSGTPPVASPQSEAKPDAANLEFSKKQVDLALQHLKDEKAKQKSELLDRLGWTKEEAQKFLENVQKLKDSAQQPGSEGEAGKNAYSEFLKNLDLHPHGTQIRGAQTKDDMRNVRDSGQMEPPSEWADLYRAYSRGTAGQK